LSPIVAVVGLVPLRRTRNSSFNLPDEISLQVMDHLDPASLYCFRQTCRSFNSMFNDKRFRQCTMNPSPFDMIQNSASQSYPVRRSAKSSGICGIMSSVMPARTRRLMGRTPRQKQDSQHRDTATDAKKNISKLYSFPKMCA
jgi:hypothetical protein